MIFTISCKCIVG